MSRMISFVILVACILLIGFVLLKVLAQFLVPMFLALLLVVMFRPLHRWFIAKCKGRNRLAAGLTTLAILLVLLLPMTWILFRAASEGVELAQKFDQQTLMAKAEAALDDVRPLADRFGIDLTASHDELIATLTAKVQHYLGPAALGGAQFVGGVLVGLAIMIISLYYFLADGPGMIATIMRLSPLDERYEKGLLVEFETVSRAVVIATLLSAFAQGLLAGAAFFVLGIPLVFLLTALTMLLALVPFVGAAAVWIPCCLWLYFYADRAPAAVFLAIYGTFVISMIDNLIKPYVLHGQSNLHPLLALLSILGGVQVLGPIGILVGPMLVAFLQALLNMLRTELDALGETQPAKASEPIPPTERIQ